MTNFQEWLKKYYPKSAVEVASREVTPLELVQHALTKWEGLRPEVLKAYQLEDVCGGIAPALSEEEDEFLNIDATSCSLCEVYTNYGDLYSASHCRNCPLAAVRAMTKDGTPVPCYEERSDEDDEGSPWNVWCEYSDPKPMIGWLEKARALVLKEPDRFQYDSDSLLDKYDPYDYGDEDD